MPANCGVRHSFAPSGCQRVHVVKRRIHQELQRVVSRRTPQRGGLPRLERGPAPHRIMAIWDTARQPRRRSSCQSDRPAPLFASERPDLWRVRQFTRFRIGPVQLGLAMVQPPVSRRPWQQRGQDHREWRATNSRSGAVRPAPLKWSGTGVGMGRRTGARQHLSDGGLR